MVLTNNKYLGFCVVIAAAALAGCGGTKACEKPKRYQASAAAPPIEVPESFDALDEQAELKIPKASPKSNAPVNPCLDEPPDYFESRPVESAEPEE